MSTQFNCQKHFYFKLFKLLYITIQFSVSTVSMSKTVQFKTIQFSLFEIELIICIKMDLALNNLRRLVCHKSNQTINLILLVEK